MRTMILINIQISIIIWQIPTDRRQTNNCLKKQPRSWTRGYREQQPAVRTGFEHVESANYGFQIRRSNHSATLLPGQTQGRHGKGRGKRKTEISKLRVSGRRKTRVLRTLSHTQLWSKASMTSRREPTHVPKAGSNYTKWSHSHLSAIWSYWKHQHT